MILYTTNIRDLIEQLEEELVDTYNDCNENDPDHKPAEHASDFRVYYHMQQRNYESNWDLYNELLRAKEALQACEGLRTAQLQAMNAVASGSLADAYEVCSTIREAHGDLAHPPEHGDAIEWALEVATTTTDLAASINSVVAWALLDANATDLLHPMNTAA